MTRSQIGVLRLWTFGSAADLVDISAKFGVNQWTAVSDLSRGSCRKDRHSLRNHRFAAAASGIFHTSEYLIGCELRVSPFDDIFPAVRWNSTLRPSDSRLRRTIESTITVLYLRNIFCYPSHLTIECKLGPHGETLSRAFRAFVSEVEAVIASYDDVGVAGGICAGGYILPPESVSPRMEQIPELRSSLDSFYPISSAPVSESRSRQFSVAAELDMFAHADSAHSFESFMSQMDDRAYREFVAGRGLFSTPDGALLFGSRSAHPLHAIAQEIFEARGSTLVPLITEKIAAGIKMRLDEIPYLLTNSERAVAIGAAVGLFSASRLGTEGRDEVLGGLTVVLQGSDFGLTEQTVGLLLCRWSRVGS